MCHATGNVERFARQKEVLCPAGTQQNHVAAVPLDSLVGMRPFRIVSAEFLAQCGGRGEHLVHLGLGVGGMACTEDRHRGAQPFVVQP